MIHIFVPFMEWYGSQIFENRITLKWPYVNKSYHNALEIGTSPRRTGCKSEWNKVEVAIPSGVYSRWAKCLYFRIVIPGTISFFSTGTIIFKWQRLSAKLLLHNFLTSNLYTGFDWKFTFCDVWHRKYWNTGKHYFNIKERGNVCVSL